MSPEELLEKLEQFMVANEWSETRGKAQSDLKKITDHFYALGRYDYTN